MLVEKKIRLIECPRDAMQGWPEFIPTNQKIEYLNALLKVGFDTLDFGSFVSPKAIPQMADTMEVLKDLEYAGSKTKLLAIVANERGAEDAASFNPVRYLGFPFSVSETFQQRNTHSGIEESFLRVKRIQKICVEERKELVVYISMGFGNPYGDEYSPGIVQEWIKKLTGIGVNIISLADTVGLASAELVSEVTSVTLNQFPDIECGVHLHASPQNWQQKFDAALAAGCTRFDGALMGIGGCPMAGDALVGNMNMEKMIERFKELHYQTGLDEDALKNALSIASRIFHS